jgi:hypothetical protein
MTVSEMGVAAAPQPAKQSLEIRGVLRDTTRLYRTLFFRSFLTGFVVFAILGLFETIVAAAAFFTFIGTTLVQGALVEVVDAEHRGAPADGIGDLYRRSWSRLGPLLGVTFLTGIGIGLGLLLLVVPGVILAIRWAVATPLVMLEGLGARAAMERSRELVRGHGKDVFRVLLNIWVRVGLAWFACALLVGLLSGETSYPGFALWLGGALASAFVTPYAAHALNVVYYRLTEPDQPILPEQDPRWQSIWHEYDAPGDSTTA